MAVNYLRVDYEQPYSEAMENAVDDDDPAKAASDEVRLREASGDVVALAVANYHDRCGSFHFRKHIIDRRSNSESS